MATKAKKAKTTKPKKRKTGKAGNASLLKKITTEAKRIRKESPNMKWQTALKKAGQKMRGKK